MFQLNRGRFGKRGIAMILCTGLVLGSLSGCGGSSGVSQGDGVSGSAVSGGAVSGSAVSEPAAEDGKAGSGISGSAVSGSAVSASKKNGKPADDKTARGSAAGKGKKKDEKGGTAKKTKRGMSSYPYCTDTNLYYEENESIWQVRLDGTHKKRLFEGKEDEMPVWVHYVDADWLYYEVWHEEDNKDILYRAPIRKDKDGYDVVRISDAEKLIVEKDIMYPAGCGTDSHYFFYGCGNSYIKYDLREQKKIVLAKDMDTVDKDIEGEEEEDDMSYVYKIGNRYVIVKEFTGVYTLDADGTHWKKADKDAPDRRPHIAQGEQAVYYMQRKTSTENGDVTGIKKCDGKRAAEFVTVKQQKDVVMKALHADKLDAFEVKNLFCDGGRLYIQLVAGWEKKGTYHMEYVLLSKEEKNDSGLRYEKKLTECMKSHGKTRNGRWVTVYGEPEPAKVFLDSMIVNDAQCIAMADGKAYLSLYDYEKHKGRLGCCDLANGKFQWVERDDALFYRLGYERNLNDFITGVFKIGKSDEENLSGDMESFIGFTILHPQVDEENEGIFLENP